MSLENSTTLTLLAEAFMQRFAGMERAYGTYDLSTPVIRGDGKRNGRAVTKREPVTLSLWLDHLAGKQPGLGIIPIRDGNDCVFGAIDVDEYSGLSHQSLVSKLKRNNISLVVCRTKSGGAHLYCFAKAPVPASKMVMKLREIASFLGFGNSEIFPKQTQVLASQGDVGQFINMPYFGGTRGMRYAVDIDGNAISSEAFLDYASNMSVATQWFDEKIVESKEFVDGPPCLQALSQIGYPPGTRNDGLYNIGVYLRRANPDDWQDMLEDANRQYMEPPLMLQEVQGIIKSLQKKDYAYACTKNPICNHCNSALCRTRKYGVGGGGAGGRFPTLGNLVKLDTKPPIWFWTVNDCRLELTTDDLQDPRRFQKKCMESLNLVTSIPSRPVWEAAVQNSMNSVTVIEAPADASPEGLFWDMLEKFCTGRAQALTLDEITLGKPFTDRGRTYFRMADLLNFLSMHKFYEFRSPKIASMLKDARADHHFSNLKGRGVNYWSIAAFARQTETFDVPSAAQDSGTPF
jgi:hypothetical protein